MKEDPSLESLRAAIRKRGQDDASDEEQRFVALARRYEQAVRQLVAEVRGVVEQVPELKVGVEDEEEAFTSPAFPGRSVRIRDQRLRVTLGEDFLLFDPTAGALASALGQVHINASRPIPFLIERTLYLVRGRDTQDQERDYWAYRSSEDPSRFAVPFTRAVLLRMLHAVFA